MADFYLQINASTHCGQDGRVGLDWIVGMIQNNKIKMLNILQFNRENIVTPHINFPKDW